MSERNRTFSKLRDRKLKSGRGGTGRNHPNHAIDVTRKIDMCLAAAANQNQKCQLVTD